MLVTQKLKPKFNKNKAPKIEMLKVTIKLYNILWKITFEYISFNTNITYITSHHFQLSYSCLR